MTGPLDGIRVVELPNIGPVQFAGMLLSDLGADVVRVDRASDVAAGRTVAGTGSIYSVIDRGRRSIGVDLKHPDGRALFLRMAERADVVVENFAPGLMEKLGLDYERLRAVNPRLIMARIKGFGLSGPYHEYKSFDMIAQATGGVMSVTGFDDREPVRCGAAIGGLAALICAARLIAIASMSGSVPSVV